MEYMDPLAKARGTGSAHYGGSHWWGQRLSSVALFPLLLWVVIELIQIAGHPVAEVRAWAAQPTMSLLLILAIVTLFIHIQQGIQMVVEDYVHTPWLEQTTQILVRFSCWVLAAAGIIALLKLLFSESQL